MSRSNKKQKFWTEQEDSFLRDNYAIKGAAFCAEHLSDRTIEAVRIRANRFKIKRDVDERYHRIETPNGYKYCAACQQILEESRFYKKKKNGSYSEEPCPTCRSCSQEKARRSYRTHKSSQQARYKSNPEKRLFENIRTRAKTKNVPFSIKLEDIIIPSLCPVLGIPIIPFSNSDNSPSIDKLIPSLGYVEGNVSVISKRANQLKSNGSLEEIEMLVVWLKKQLRKE